MGHTCWVIHPFDYLQQFYHIPILSMNEWMNDCFNVRSKADWCQLNLPHVTEPRTKTGNRKNWNQKWICSEEMAPIKKTWSQWYDISMQSASERRVSSDLFYSGLCRQKGKVALFFNSAHCDSLTYWYIIIILRKRQWMILLQVKVPVTLYNLNTFQH